MTGQQRASGGLKPGWRRVKFGEVVRHVKDKVDPETSGLARYIAGEHMDTDDLTLRRWGEIGPDYLGPAFHMRFKPGQVLYGSRRTYLRKVAVADFEGITANTTFVLEPRDPSVLLPELLPFLMQTEAFHEHSIKQSRGSVNPYVNFSDLAWFEFALPPLGEQQRVTRLLARVQKVVEEDFSSALSAVQLMRAIQKQSFLENPVGDRCKVGDVAVVRNGTTPRRTEDRFWGGDIPWLPTGKVNEQRITSADEFVTSNALKNTSLSIIPASSTLIAMIGQGQTRGKAAFLCIDATINQNFAAVIPGKNVDAEFLYFQLDALYENLRRWSHGTNQHALNCKLVAEFPIVVPDYAQQVEIRTAIAAVNAALYDIEQRRLSSKKLLKHKISATLGQEAA